MARDTNPNIATPDEDDHDDFGIYDDDDDKNFANMIQIQKEYV